jgi:hypothetical protein
MSNLTAMLILVSIVKFFSNLLFLSLSVNCEFAHSLPIYCFRFPGFNWEFDVNISTTNLQFLFFILADRLMGMGFHFLLDNLIVKMENFRFEVCHRYFLAIPFFLLCLLFTQTFTIFIINYSCWSRDINQNLYAKALLLLFCKDNFLTGHLTFIFIYI